MLAHYKLDKNGIDSSGHENHTSPVSVSYSDGKIGYAASFDGTGYIDTELLDDYYVGDSELTIATWVKPTLLGSYLLFSTNRLSNDRIYAWTNGSVWSVNIGNASAAGTTTAVVNE